MGGLQEQSSASHRAIDISSQMLAVELFVFGWPLIGSPAAGSGRSAAGSDCRYGSGMNHRPSLACSNL